MTEEKKSMVPKLRFPEFTETWEQRKLGDIGTVQMNKRIFKTQTSTSGEIPFYKIGTFGKIPDAYISRELFEEYKKKYPYPKKGDLLLSASGSIGNVVEYNGEEAYFQDSNIVWLEHGKTISNFFLKAFYSVVNWEGIEGTTIKRLYNKTILDTPITLPSFEEQEKIGNFFTVLDKVITLHQRKLDVLNKLKKYLLQKMFPENGQLIPELRFPAFSGAWEQRKLSEIVRMNARIGWQNLRQSEFLDDGDFLLITGTDFKNGRVNFGTCHYIAKERFDQDPKIQVEEGSILLTKDGTIGKVALVDKLSKPATLNAGVYNIVPKNRVVESRFLFQYLSAPFLLDYVNKAATGGTIKHLNQSILVDFPVSFPSVAEQEKIGKFLEGIDHVTTLHQRKLEGLRKLKKSLLQQMFV